MQSFIADSTWTQFAKIKYPSLAKNSDHYKELRHAFMVGIHTTLGLVQKAPEDLILDLMAEVKEELYKDKNVIIQAVNGKRRR